jgi:hypothetical protein
VCYQEITEDEFNTLDEYEKKYNVRVLPVFAIKVDGETLPFEWFSGFAKIGAMSSHDSTACFEKHIKEKYGVDNPYEALKVGDIPALQQSTKTYMTPHPTDRAAVNRNLSTHITTAK